MTTDFELQTLDRGAAITVIRVRGRMDAHNMPVLVRACQQVRTSGRSLVLNLSGVSFIASSGVGALLALVDEYRQHSADLQLAEVSEAVGAVLKLLHLEPYLPIQRSEAAACGEAEAA